jgi:hypothetical protein
LNLFGSAMFGDGLRFNNPYRLPHDLGERGASVSTTAPYVDLAVAATTGKPDGLQHGARVAWSVSLSGVPQQVITPAYLALCTPRRPGPSTDGPAFDLGPASFNVGASSRWGLVARAPGSGHLRAMRSTAPAP